MKLRFSCALAALLLFVFASAAHAAEDVEISLVGQPGVMDALQASDLELNEQIGGIENPANLISQLHLADGSRVTPENAHTLSVKSVFLSRNAQEDGPGAARFLAECNRLATTRQQAIASARRSANRIDAVQSEADDRQLLTQMAEMQSEINALNERVETLVEEKTAAVQRAETAEQKLAALQAAGTPKPSSAAPPATDTQKQFEPAGTSQKKGVLAVRQVVPPCRPGVNTRPCSMAEVEKTILEQELGGIIPQITTLLIVLLIFFSAAIVAGTSGAFQAWADVYATVKKAGKPQQPIAASNIYAVLQQQANLGNPPNLESLKNRRPTWERREKDRRDGGDRRSPESGQVIEISTDASRATG